MHALLADEASLRQTVQSNPSEHAAWHALGLLYFNAGNLLLAVQMIEAAIAIHDKVALYHRNIGELYRRMGQLERSKLAGRRAIKLAPADLDAHYNLGRAYTDAKEYKKAINCYRRALLSRASEFSPEWQIKYPHPVGNRRHVTGSDRP